MSSWPVNQDPLQEQPALGIFLLAFVCPDPLCPPPPPRRLGLLVLNRLDLQSGNPTGSHVVYDMPMEASTGLPVCNGIPRMRPLCHNLGRDGSCTCFLCFPCWTRSVRNFETTQSGEVILITPWWPSQPWFPYLIQLHQTLFLPYCQDLLSQPGHIWEGKSYHLHVWRLSCSISSF